MRPAYTLPEDRQLQYPDTQCRRATEDRDLIREALDLDACIGAALEATTILYPPVRLAWATIPTQFN